MTTSPPPLRVDLLVIGGGAAGLAAARTGVSLGARTALVSDGPPGGERTWAGTVPIAALLAAAAAGTPYPTALAAMREVRSVIAAGHSAAALGAEGVTVLTGRARFLARDRAVEAVVERAGSTPRDPDPQGRRVSAARVVVATGALPVLPSVAGLLDVAYLTPRTVLDVEDLPYSLVILGGGATGCELAQAYVRFGSRVTLVEHEDRLLPTEDPAAGQAVRAALEADGVRVLLGGTVSRVAPTLDGGAYVGTDVGGDVAATHLLLAAGRRPNVTGLAVDVVGARTGPSGAVVVDDLLRTAAAGVLAAGEVTGLADSSHAAAAMGALAARNALAPSGPVARMLAQVRVQGQVHGRGPERWSSRVVPAIVRTDPSVARVGLTRADAARLDGVRYGEVAFADTDRGRLAGAAGVGVGSAGVGVSVAPRLRRGGSLGRRLGGDVVVGATVVGPTAGGADAAELIAPLVLAVQARVPVARLRRTIQPDLTYAADVVRALTSSDRR